MKKMIMFGILMVLCLLPGVARALTPSYSCINETHMTKEIVIDKSRNGSITEYRFNETIFCPHGCEDGLGKYGADCIEPAYITTTMVVVGIILFIGFLFVVGRGKR